jgi:hypothetical protein
LVELGRQLVASDHGPGMAEGFVEERTTKYYVQTVLPISIKFPFMSALGLGDILHRIFLRGDLQSSVFINGCVAVNEIEPVFINTTSD